MTTLYPGEVLDATYRILRPIGEGGMGSVYEAEHVRIARRVAIKVMHAQFSAERDLAARFEREAQAAAKVGSSYVVDVLDLGRLPSGQQYMVMEFLEGESLGARLRSVGQMPPGEVTAIALQLLDGLAKVHDAGIIHRDLKPGNIFLARAEDGRDFVKLLDFGICKFTERMSLEPAGSERLLGTLGYIAPEVMAGEVADPRSDIYSVGVVLFRCAAGVLPYVAGNPLDLIVKIQRGATLPLDRRVPGIDARFAELVGRAISPDPDLRFADARAMRDALGEWQAAAGRVDRLLAGFLELEIDPIEPTPPVPPRARSESDRPRTQSDVREMLRPAVDGRYAIHIDERTTREVVRGPGISDSGTHRKARLPSGFSAQEAPTKPRRRMR